MQWQQQLSNPDLVQCGIFINGQWQTANRAHKPLFNPATGEQIAAIAQATPEDLPAALAASVAAHQQFKQLTAKARSRLLADCYRVLMDNVDDLALILTMEQGKPLAEARAEIEYGANYFQWYSEEAKRNYGYTIPANNPKQRIHVNYEPVGVCAAITPWNFPHAMLARKVAPALAAGCSMLAKPASQTPLSANALAYLAQQAGVPAGLFNVLHGHSGAIGEFFCHAPQVRKLSFTGSTEVGIWLYQNCANSMKKLSLELGGNAPLIVCADADLSKATAGIMQSKFRNNGQTCVCSNRILVHASLKDQLIANLRAAMSLLTLGNGLAPTTQLGPLIDNQALIHIQSLLADARANGAQIVQGGAVVSELGPLFLQPTLVDCPQPNLRLFKEEIFGPVVAIYSFNSDEEAIQLANASQYGLASYVFSESLARVYRYSEELAFGMVGVNSGQISAENVPFGGVKMSGLGKEGGRSGLMEYLVEKYVCIDLG